jgi:ribosomal protein L37E
MKISNQTTFTWVNGWSMTIVPAWNCVKVSVMGPRQVFYTISEDRTYVQPSADEAFDYLSTKGLAEVMVLIGRMPSRVTVEPFAVEEPKKESLSGVPMPSSVRLRAKATITCRVCGGDTQQVGTVRTCDDCGHGAEGVAYDPNEFNSMQS